MADKQPKKTRVRGVCEYFSAGVPCRHKQCRFLHERAVPQVSNAPPRSNKQIQALQSIEKVAVAATKIVPSTPTSLVITLDSDTTLTRTQFL